MSKLQDYMEERIKKNGLGAEYEDAYRSCKKLNLVLAKAVLGEARKEEIETAIIEMQGSLEIVKTCADINTTTVAIGVNKLFGIEVAKPVKETVAIPKAPSSRKRK